jgi:predicted DNA-binding ribbon-helix-helix protein
LRITLDGMTGKRAERPSDPQAVRLRLRRVREWNVVECIPFWRLAPMSGGDALYRGPIKRSVTIAGHQTSISLEPAFWSALERAATDAAIPLNALVARIDAERISVANPPNLASAIRLWLLMRQQADHARESHNP